MQTLGDYKRLYQEFSYIAGLEIKIFSREPNCIFMSFIKVVCMSNSTYLGSLQKFEGATGAFKGVEGSRHPLISSPDRKKEPYLKVLIRKKGAIHMFHKWIQ